MDHDVIQFAQVMTVLVISVASLVVIGLGARILWRFGSRVTPPPMPLPDEARQQRLETAVDSIAIEVERISEAQRFMVSLLHEPLPARRAERANQLPGADRAGRVDTPH